MFRLLVLRRSILTICSLTAFAAQAQQFNFTALSRSLIPEQASEKLLKGSGLTWSATDGVSASYKVGAIYD